MPLSIKNKLKIETQKVLYDTDRYIIYYKYEKLGFETAFKARKHTKYHFRMKHFSLKANFKPKLP